MCKIRYPKFILDVLNTLGVKTDVFIKKGVQSKIDINFMGDRMNISGNLRLMSPPGQRFCYTYSSPDSITNYYIPEGGGTFVRGDYKAICRNAVYLEINSTVYIDRR